MTGHSHLPTSSTFSAKVGKMAEAQLVASVVLQELLEELVPPRCESDDELEFIASLLLETKRTPATRITGYFENVVPNLSHCKLKKLPMRRNTFLWLTVYAEHFTHDCLLNYVQIITTQY